jgi:hypothetical protein
MTTLTIFGLQLVLSLLVFALIAKWYVVPRLACQPLRLELMALIFPHAFRHVGLAFLVPGLVSESLPDSFAITTAYGDFISGLLAILSLVALRQKWVLAIPLVWIFNLVGSVDLLNALRQAEAVPHLLTTWYIPTFWVPLLLVSHALMFTRLLRRKQQGCELQAQA